MRDDGNSVSLPAGSGFSAGFGESFQVNPNTGQGVYSYPLGVPPGIAGFSPVLRLEYASAFEQSAFGLGWRLPLREIVRSLDLGLPEPGGDAGAREQLFDGATELIAMPDGTYRGRREALFARYEQAGAGWRIVERTGVRHELGTTPAARVADPAHPERVFRWLLERSIDTNGNEIRYEYEQRHATPYLRSVQYATYEVRLVYAPRPDPRRSGRCGFLSILDRRCEAVEVRIGDVPVRSWRLGYEVDALNGASLLHRIEARGRGADGTEVARPPMRFRYASASGAAPSIRWLPPGLPSLADPDVALVTLDDVALPGWLQVVNGRHVYWANRGELQFDPPRPIAAAPLVRTLGRDAAVLADMNANGTADLVVTGAATPLHGYYENGGGDRWSRFVAYPRARGGAPPLARGAVRIADLDGDGRIDALAMRGRALAQYRNHGEHGWSGPRVVHGPALDLHDPNVRMADLTGDGLADLVRLRPGAVEYWPNLGHGRFGDRVVLAVDLATARPEELVLADLDGDGVADLARVSATGVEIWINRGGAGFAPRIHVPVVPAPVPGTARGADLTGRGRDALVWVSMRGGAPAHVCFELGTDAARYRLISIDHGTGLHGELHYATSVDEAVRDRSASRAWTTHLPFPVTVVSAMRERDELTGRESEVRYRYHEGHFEPRTRQFQGFARVEQWQRGDESQPDRLRVHHFLAGQERRPGAGPEAAALNGLLARLEVFALDGTPASVWPLHVEECDAEVTALPPAVGGEPRHFVSIRASRVRHRDRAGDERLDERRFDYDDVGNVTREVRRYAGHRAGVAVAEIVEVSELTYARNLERGIVDRVARVVRRDGSGQLLGELRRYYDGAPFVGLPLGQVGAGREARVEKLALHAPAFAEHYEGLDAAVLGYTAGTDADGAAGWFIQAERRSHDARGLTIAELDPMGRLTERRYDAAGLFVIGVDTPIGSSEIVNDATSGHPVRVEDPDGTVVRFSYDGFGRATAAWMPGDPDDAPTRRYVYDDTARPRSVQVTTKLELVTARSTREVVYFDGAGKELQRRVAAGPERVVVSGHVRRGAGGLVIAEYEPTLDTTLAYAAVSTEGRAARRFSYDGLDRPIRVVNYDGGTSTCTITAYGVATVDAEGQRREEHCDAAHRRRRVIEGGEETRYVPGPSGELREIHDARGLIGTWYGDLLGNRLGVDHRDGGMRRVCRDATGRVVRTLDGRGRSLGATYDEAGRLSTVSDDGVVVETYAYDAPEPGGWNRLAEVQFAGGRDRWRYDARGAVREEIHEVDGVGTPFVLRYGRDALGRERRAELPGGAIVETIYTDHGLVAQVPGFVDHIEYDARNLPTRIRYANGVITDLGYSAGPGRVTSQRTVGPGGPVLANEHFTLDRLSRVKTADDRLAARAQQLAFDPLGQLKRVEVEGEPPITYGYVGRELVRLDEIETTLTLGDLAHPGRVTAVTVGTGTPFQLEYDLDGDITTLPGRSLTYDTRHQLVRCERDDGTVAEYGYDHRGRRRWKRVRSAGITTETIMLGDRVEIRDTNVAYYVRAGALRVALVAGGQSRFLHSDHLGSVRFFTDEQGTRIAAVAYHPFGNPRTPDATPADLRMFALHPFDSESGLYYMGRRHYAPELGRFTSPDPRYLLDPDLDRADGSTLALYSYCGNDPVDYCDPSGLTKSSVVGAVVGTIAGIAAGILFIGAILAGGWVLVALMALALVAITAVGYIVATTTTGKTAEFFRGFLVGFSAGLNATVGTYFGVGALLWFGVGAFAALGIGFGIGCALGMINFLASVDSVSQNEVYQGVLSWSSWFMPNSWVVNALGVGALVISALVALFSGNAHHGTLIDGIEVDWATGTFFLKGGWVSNWNQIDTAFNLGHFALVDINNNDPMELIRAHEAGHGLNVAAFGSVFHGVGFVDEWFFQKTEALAERLAEGNYQPSLPGRPKHPMWS